MVWRQCRFFLSTTRRQNQNGGKQDTAGPAMEIGLHGGSDHSGKPYCRNCWKSDGFSLGQHHTARTLDLWFAVPEKYSWHV